MEHLKIYEEFLNEAKKSETMKSISVVTAKIRSLRKEKAAIKKREKREISIIDNKIKYLERNKSVLKSKRKNEIFKNK